MNPFDGIDGKELTTLSDPDFRQTVKARSRFLVEKAMRTYEEVMDDDDDPGARVLAADRIMKFAEAEDTSKSLPTGLSEEIFKVALLGLGSLAKIAGATTESEKLRDVTPARADPRLTFIPDDSPLNRPPVLPPRVLVENGLEPKEIFDEEDLKDLEER